MKCLADIITLPTEGETNTHFHRGKRLNIDNSPHPQFSR